MAQYFIQQNKRISSNRIFQKEELNVGEEQKIAESNKKRKRIENGYSKKVQILNFRNPKTRKDIENKSWKQNEKANLKRKSETDEEQAKKTKRTFHDDKKEKEKKESYESDQRVKEIAKQLNIELSDESSTSSDDSREEEGVREEHIQYKNFFIDTDNIENYYLSEEYNETLEKIHKGISDDSEISSWETVSSGETTSEGWITEEEEEEEK